MIICSCRVISDTKANEVIQQGVKCCKDFNKIAGEPDCGFCAPTIKSMIKNCQDQK